MTSRDYLIQGAVGSGRKGCLSFSYKRQVENQWENSYLTNSSHNISLLLWTSPVQLTGLERLDKSPSQAVRCTTSWTTIAQEVKSGGISSTSHRLCPNPSPYRECFFINSKALPSVTVQQPPSFGHSIYRISSSISTISSQKRSFWLTCTGLPNFEPGEAGMDLQYLFPYWIMGA